MAKGFFSDKRNEATVAPDESAMVYYPVLLVGLGGTGAKTLLRVKKLLQNRFPTGHYLHRFLFIDTDNNTFRKHAGLPEIEEHERCLIGVKTVGNFLEDPDLYPHIFERFPKSAIKEQYIRSLANGIGASQIRALGALAIALDCRNVYDKIKAAHDDLIQLRNRVIVQAQERGAVIADEVKPYIVGSLAGGTGSGCFVDVAMIVNDICKGSDSTISAMFALPGGFDAKLNDPDQVKNIRLNTYAALREIQLLQDPDTDERKKIGTIRFKYENDRVLEIVQGKKLFGLCHLIDDRNENGRLSTMEDLYTLIARSIFHEVATAFGGDKKTAESNNTVLNGLSRCPKTGKLRQLGTVSTAALVFPAERLTQYCTFQTVSMVVTEVLLGTSLTDDLIKNKVSSFLSGHDYEERGANNALIERLLYSQDAKAPISPGDFITKSFGKNKNAAQFLDAIREEWENFNSRTLPALEMTVEGNRKAILFGESEMLGKEVQTHVREFSLNLAKESGVRAVRDSLTSLDRVVRDMKEELEKETDKWKNEKATYFQEFNAACDNLQHLGFVKKRILNHDVECKSRILDVYENYIQQSLWASARRAALEVLEQLGSKVKEVSSKWDNLNVLLKQLGAQVKNEATKIEAEKRMDLMTSFSVELDVTEPGYEIEYYEQNRIGKKEALSSIVKQCENSEVRLYEELLARNEWTEIGDLIAQPLYDVFAPKLFATNIIDFVIAKGKSGEGELVRLLQLTDKLCKPFWKARSVGSIDFKDYVSVSALPERIENGTVVLHKTLQKWMPKSMQPIASDISYEITLSRRTYGARAFYLEQSDEWRAIYEHQKRKYHKEFMVETHMAFQKAPDLFPLNDVAQRFFAIGMAMGFIVKRGDWYYKALEWNKDDNGRDVIRVLYKSEKKDWTTVHTLDNAPELPAQIGRLNLSAMKSMVDKTKHLLAQGRERSQQALIDDPKFIELLQEAFNDYHSERGTALLKHQLREYQSKVLEPLSEGDNVYEQELEAISDQCLRLGN
jgi:hypothetical protein